MIRQRISAWSAFYWLAIRFGGCSAASHTAHWTISLSDDGSVSEPNRFVNLNKWTVNESVNGSKTDYLIVAADSINRTEVQLYNATAIVSPPTLPAEALEEHEAIAENLDSMTTTVTTPALPSFTVFGGPMSNFVPLFGLPLTLPSQVISSTTTAPTTTTTNTTTTVSTITSSDKTTTVPTITVDLPTLPPFDMRRLPSLIQMAKLIPAIVRSFGASGDSIPSILPSGNAIGSLFPAPPTSSAVVNAAGGDYSGLPSTNFAANAAPTVQLFSLSTAVPSMRLDQLTRTPDASLFGNIGEIFAVNKAVRPPTVDIRRLPTSSSNAMKQDGEFRLSAVDRPIKSVLRLRESTGDTVVQGPVHLGTPSNNLLTNVKADGTKSNEDLQFNQTDDSRKIPSFGGWSHGSAERRPGQLKGAERQMRLNLYNKEKIGDDNYISIGERSQNKIPYTFDRDKGRQTDGDETIDSTVSPYAAPMPPSTMTSMMSRRERPRFMTAAPATDNMDENGGNEKLASAQRDIFRRNPEVFWDQGDVKKTRQDIFSKSMELDQQPEIVQDDSDLSWPSAQRAELARQRVFAGPTKIQQKFTATETLQSAESQLHALTGRLPAGLGSSLDATALSELAAIRQLPELGELTRGLDLGLLARPGGYATLRQQFLERLVSRTAFKATEQAKKHTSDTVPLRIRR